MPKTPRPGKRTVYVEMEAALFAGLEALASRRRWSIRAAVEEAVKALVAADLEPAVPAGRGRRQKKKGGGS